MPAPVASGWSDRRVGLAPTGKAPPCHGARGERSFAKTESNGEVAPVPAIRRTQLKWLFADSELSSSAGRRRQAASGGVSAAMLMRGLTIGEPSSLLETIGSMKPHRITS